jgi:hypothetical protein
MKYKIYPYKDGFEIAADREALMWISEICQAEPGSTPLIILYKPDL